MNLVLQKFFKLFISQSYITNDVTHRYGVDRVWRGTVIIRFPSVMTMCLPCRATQKPAFSKARTALRWLIPANLGKITVQPRLL